MIKTWKAVYGHWVAVSFVYHNNLDRNEMIVLSCHELHLIKTPSSDASKCPLTVSVWPEDRVNNFTRHTSWQENGLLYRLQLKLLNDTGVLVKPRPLPTASRGEMGHLVRWLTIKSLMPFGIACVKVMIVCERGGPYPAIWTRQVFNSKFCHHPGINDKRLEVRIRATTLFPVRPYFPDPPHPHWIIFGPKS